MRMTLADPRGDQYGPSSCVSQHCTSTCNIKAMRSLRLTSLNRPRLNAIMSHCYHHQVTVFFKAPSALPLTVHMSLLTKFVYAVLSLPLNPVIIHTRQKSKLRCLWRIPWFPGLWKGSSPFYRTSAFICTALAVLIALGDSGHA